jgi:hypothetical protein
LCFGSQSTLFRNAETLVLAACDASAAQEYVAEARAKAADLNEQIALVEAKVVQVQALQGK